VEPLTEALKDEVLIVSYAAARALEEIRSEKGQVKKGNE
jgi:HEAT repeat protein